MDRLVNTNRIKRGQPGYVSPLIGKKRIGYVHPLKGKELARRPIEVRFWEKVEKRGESECWTWKGSINGKGYGQLFSHYRDCATSRYGRVAVPVGAHQLSYRIHKGPVPDGLVIDHICMNTICVNPAHLRAVTQAVNSVENSNSMPARNKRKTECKRGHPFAGDNLVLDGRGHRHCRACGEMRARREI